MRDVELLRYSVLAAQREGNRLLTRALHDLRLTPAQSEALRILGDHEPLTLTGLGEMLVCDSGSNPSRLVDRLVSAGLVERKPGTHDRRQVTLSLTPAGHAAESAVRRIESAFYAELDDALHDVDLAPIIRLLGRLSEGSPAGRALARRFGEDAVAGSPG
ncbi:MAG TPA: MarR family transcriptional regulator [Lacisediminihabitans sp.]|uniref:MarR family winged helix-turn-helix transcriptional regulator n=1 Tax=Lacisediminihabitans sp. TaxID=2787631 RepID=UPI002EDAEEA7